jgi:penicillin-binding protein 2
MKPTSDILHEVLFEDRVGHIGGDHRLFIGRAYPFRRFGWAFGCVALAVVVLLGRAGWMQVRQAALYQSLAEANRLRRTHIPPRRGIIRDRQGVIIADNISRFQVTLLPRDVPVEGERREAVLSRAARLLGMPLADLGQLANVTGTSRDETVLIAEQLSYPEAMAFAVAQPDLAGFALEVGSRRRYPASTRLPSLSHVLGYVGKLSPDEYAEQRLRGYRRTDEIGKTGLERSYESILRGSLGERVTEVDARGRIRALVGDRPPVDGRDITLSLDIALQGEMEQALRDGLALAKVTRGAAMALDPRDGSILAAVSWPAYDNNVFSGTVSSTVYQGLINNPDQPLFSRLWSGNYPSGSTAKIVISTIALAEKIITPATTIFSSGGIRVGPWFFPDWKPGGHGTVNVKGAIAWSVNTFYYTIGGGYESFVGLGVDALTKGFRQFGLGSSTGLDVPGEADGFVPSREWKERTKGERWFVGDTYNLSIGQGDLLVTPTQVAVYTATIANGGELLRPHFVAAIEDSVSSSSLREQSSPTRVADKDLVEVVRQGMRECVQYGSCRSLSDLPFPSAGKTGTAQAPAEKLHAWFTSFAPYESPEVVVTVLLEEGGEGSSFAAPVAKRVLAAWWRLRAERGGTC